MSHFAVAVRVESSCSHANIHDRLGEILLPFKESGAGDHDPPGLKKYLEFHDTEDEMRSDWEKDSCSVVRLASGEVVSKFDNRLRNPNWKPFGGGVSDEYLVPAGAESFEMAVRERYPDFDEYATDYCGAQKDADKKRYGYWQNPNKRWDWWTIGGRFSDRLPDGLGFHDVLRINQVALEVVRANAEKFRSEFLEEYQKLADGHEFPVFDGPRDQAVDLGFIECKNADELDGGEWKLLKWPRQTKPGVDRFDVLKQITKEDLEKIHIGFFARHLYTWAYVHGGEWHEKGKMGFWAMSDATPESRAEYLGRFDRMIAEGDPSDWIAIVDCHI